MRRLLSLLIVVLGLTLAVASTAAAQGSRLESVNNAVLRPDGWSITPVFGYTGAWDDNILIRGKEDVTPDDYTSAISPRLALQYNSRRSQFATSYEGSFLVYRNLGGLNTFDQRLGSQMRRMLTRRVTWFARGTLAESPTTELLGVVAVPFVRIGSRMADTRTGVEALVTKHTTVTANYGFTWIDFDQEPIFGIQLLGGTSHGGSGGVRHHLNDRLTAIGNYDLQFARVVEGGFFQVQNTQGGFEVLAWKDGRIFGTAGVSRLDYSKLDAPRLGPAYGTGFNQRFPGGSFDVTYGRSFVPSYGFAGTSQNEEFQVRLTSPLGLRWYSRLAFAWRQTEPLIQSELKLASTWFEGTVGYTVLPWMRIEGFYDAMHQNIARPGGVINRNRLGVQFITAKPMRIR